MERATQTATNNQDSVSMTSSKTQREAPSGNQRTKTTTNAIPKVSSANTWQAMSKTRRANTHRNVQS